MVGNSPFNFEKLEVWKLAVDFSGLIYNVTEDFAKNELFGLTMQLRRSSVSVAANIAEGSGRHSNKDFTRFLRISLGSLYECITELTIAKKQGFLNEEVFESLNNKAKSIAKMLNALISSLSKV